MVHGNRIFLSGSFRRLSEGRAGLPMLGDLISPLLWIFFFRGALFFFSLETIDICRIWRLTPRSCFTLPGT